VKFQIKMALKVGDFVASLRLKGYGSGKAVMATCGKRAGAS